MHRCRKNPRITRFLADSPTRFVNVDDHLQGDQLSDRVVLLLPVIGQLVQQRVGLGLGQFQFGEEADNLAGVVQRHSDPEVKKRQCQNDFDAVFTAAGTQTRRKRQVR